MGVLLAKCPATGKTFSTGIQVETTTIDTLPQVRTNSTRRISRRPRAPLQHRASPGGEAAEVRLRLWSGVPRRLAELAGPVLPGSPADFGKLVAQENEKWGKGM